MRTIRQQVGRLKSSTSGGTKFLRWDLTGYYTKSSKTWLLVKEDAYEEAMQVFSATNIRITLSGPTYLGTTIGYKEFKSAYVRVTGEEWKTELEKLADIEASQPQAAYCALNQGL